MTTRTLPRPAVAPDRSAPAALVLDPQTTTRGRAAGYPRRREGPAKLTGAAKYTDDLVFPGAWYGATIRSTEARARLLGIELDPELDWSGVVVVTAADIPGENLVSAIKEDQPVLVPIGGEIRHHSEPVALLAGPDQAIVRRLKAHIRLVTEALVPVFDPEASDHVFAELRHRDGRPRRGLRPGGRDPRGRVPRRTPGTALHREQRDDRRAGRGRRHRGPRLHAVPVLRPPALTKSLALGAEQARVIQAETGGGFGGKEEYPSIIALHAALLARKCGRPVRMIYDRHEDLAATTKRHPAIVRHRTGALADGTLVAMDIEIVMDGGAYCTLTPVVLSRGALHAGGPYRCPSVHIRARATRTNTPPNGAFRGFGAPQTEFAMETHLNRLAEQLGLSPAEIRRRNAYEIGDVTPTGQVLRESVAAQEVLRRAVEASEFERIRVGDRPGRRRTTRVGHGAGRAAAVGGRADRERDRPRPRLARGRVHRFGRGPHRLGRRRSSCRRTHGSGCSSRPPRWARGPRPSSR